MLPCKSNAIPLGLKNDDDSKAPFVAASIPFPAIVNTFSKNFALAITVGVGELYALDEVIALLDMVADALVLALGVLEATEPEEVGLAVDEVDEVKEGLFPFIAGVVVGLLVGVAIGD